MALKEEYGDGVAFIIVDVRQQKGYELAQEYGIKSIPHIIMWDATGEMVYNEVGGKSEDDLRNQLESLKGM